MRMHRLRRGLKFVLFATIVLAAASLLLMILWNRLMPRLLGRPTISFWDALSLLVMSRILFGGLRGRPGPAHWHWRRRLFERWEQMTPEERARFRQGLQSRSDRFEAPTEPRK